MGLLLGIDGGGTKTEALVCNETGVILSRGIAGPSNPISNGKEQALASVREAVRMAACKLRADPSLDCAAICVPGISKYQEEIDIKYLQNPKNITISSDIWNTYHSAVAKPHGITVLSGTGSFAAGINRKGERLVLGGWGPVLGDEGSGYSIGISCLKAVIREYEQTGCATLLTPMVMDYFNVNDLIEIRRIIYSDKFDKSRIAGLSMLVQEAAQKGDGAALDIVRDAAEQLAALACDIVNRLDMTDMEYDAVLTGGVSNFGELILKPFTECILRRYPNINIRKPRFKPVVGSLLIAMAEYGIDINNEIILRNLEDSYSKILE